EVTATANLLTALEAEIEAWPPPGNDESSLSWTVERLRANPAGTGFYIWYVILLEDQCRKLVGLVAFKGPPDADGTIEAGYSIVEKLQRGGMEQEATRAIWQGAFENPAVKLITAETFPELESSIKVMERCGMKFLGLGTSEPGAIRYGVNRENFEMFMLENQNRIEPMNL